MTCVKKKEVKRSAQAAALPQARLFLFRVGTDGRESGILTLDEFEAIRLIDLEKRAHEQCDMQTKAAHSQRGDLRKSAGQDRGLSRQRQAAVNGSAARALPAVPDAERKTDPVIRKKAKEKRK